MRLRIDPTSPSGLSVVTDLGTNVFVSGSSTSGTSDHAELTNLDYASSGHTGFEPAKGSDDNYVTDTEKTNLHAPMSDNQVADGVTITGTGTVGDPFVAVTGGAGDVVGPAGAVDSNFAAFDTNTGKLLKDSGSKAGDFATSGHNHTGVYQPVMGADDNYVTDAEKIVIGNTSGANTGDVTISGEDYLSITNQAITTNAIDLDNLSATGTTDSTTYLRGDNTWAPIVVGSGGFSGNVYVSNTDSDVAGYKTLNYTPDASETVRTITLSNETKLSETALYGSDLGVTVLPSGVWRSVFYAKVNSASGTTTLSVQAFVRAADTSETNLFTMTSSDINSTDYARVVIESAQPIFNVNHTDRFGIRISVTTDRVASTNVYYKVGDGSACYINTTLATRHSQLREWNEDASYQHISLTNLTDLTDSGATTLHKHSYNNLDDKPTIPVKATGAELDTGTDDAKFATAKALTDSSYAKTSDITATKLDDFATPDNNTDLDANTTNHGLLLKATAPAAGLTNVVAIENGETVYKNKALFDATAPSTQAFGDSAATGSATVAARRDHKHAMPTLVSILESVYPVGCIYTTITSTNPATVFGFGTWEAFGAGKVLVGLASGDTAFDTVEETGGVKEVTLTAAQSGIPAHSHVVQSGARTNAWATPNLVNSYQYQAEAHTNTSTTEDNSAASAASAHTNLQPYIVVYFFKRTA